jgi:hypothetical protein
MNVLYRWPSAPNSLISSFESRLLNGAHAFDEDDHLDILLEPFIFIREAFQKCRLSADALNVWSVDYSQMRT